jgi:Outer membrane protein beta-barrel domain
VTFPIRRLIVLVASVSFLAGVPWEASAQGFGIGPRLSWVRDNLPSDTSAGRFVGGTLRMRVSKRSALEFTMDYRSETNAAGTARLRETPFQGSLLVYLTPGVLSPYLIGGYGVYSRKADVMDGPLVVSTVEDRKTGWHIGLGGELMLGRHAGFFVDYRYRFVRFGAAADDAEDIDIPGLSAIKVSHQGSMWTSGIAFYF